VQEALETFRWHRHATVDEETYHALHREHRLIADVVCFPGCHINHLTPRTLDIDRVQALMPECGIEPKALIEGPPRREVPILLRQTSFKALEEPVMFAGEHKGTHSARFGEIEQRGIALTPKGRALYDRLLQAAGTGKTISAISCICRRYLANSRQRISAPSAGAGLVSLPPDARRRGASPGVSPGRRSAAAD
jgi:uncharacterized glyoxalase superfamily metalloenzyme YdcJ